MALSLYDFLIKHAPNRLGLGDNFDPIAFQRDLGSVAADVRRMYWMTAIMIASVFCIEVAVGLFYHNQPFVLGGIAAAIGVTIWGAVDRMGRLAREMAQTNLVLILSERLTSEMIARTVQTLLDGFKRDLEKHGTQG
jgi:hypothetical protein